MQLYLYVVCAHVCLFLHGFSLRACVGVKALTLHVWGHPPAQAAALINLKRNLHEDIINKGSACICN